MRLRKQAGFTLIEMLMVIMLVAILAAVAIPQFVDFRTEARNSAVQSALGAVRTGIANQYGQMRLRCPAAAPGQWPTALNVAGNDITTGAGAVCTTTDVAVASERQFIPSNEFPKNEWSDPSVVETPAARAVTACSGSGCNRDGSVSCDGSAWSPANTAGWCYNQTNGQFWANSNRNGGAAGRVEWNF